jgi:S-adenosylmethionine:tRNA ribosyltransferase-isomerase
MSMRIDDFDYTLPPDFIAQTPIEPRDQARLMVLDRQKGTLKHDYFFNLPGLLQPGDVLVFNDTRVIPARLHGIKDTGAHLEILLLQRLSPNTWQTLVKPAKRLSTGTRLRVIGLSKNGLEIEAEVTAAEEGGIRILKFSDDKALMTMGQVPLPPYIHEPLADPERYQTVYARVEGSAAAPTAGLHFTPGLLEKLKDRGIRSVFITLHVGLDTFQPVREDDPTKHKIHREFGIVPMEAAAELAKAKAEGRRIICVGTTSTRLVEATAEKYGTLNPAGFSGWVDLFIIPGYKFRVADSLITNFHLPRTTLLMLVSAFTGRESILKAYEEAIREHYRFYSFGDAMMIR